MSMIFLLDIKETLVSIIQNFYPLMHKTNFPLKLVAKVHMYPEPSLQRLLRKYQLGSSPHPQHNTPQCDGGVNLHDRVILSDSRNP